MVNLDSQAATRFWIFLDIFNCGPSILFFASMTSLDSVCVGAHLSRFVLFPLLSFFPCRGVIHGFGDFVHFT